MNYGGAFTYMFSQEDWVKKFVIGIAMFFIPVLGPIVLSGWALDVLRNLQQGEPDPLPEWTGDDFARWLGRGMGLSVSVLTFMLPVIAVILALFTCGAIAASQAGDIVFMCLSCLFLIMYAIAGLGAQVVAVRYASTDRLDVGLDYAKTFNLVMANIAPLLIIVVLMFIMGIIVAILTPLSLGLIIFFAPTYIILVMAFFGAELAKLPGFTE
jgi:hypothetical protein